MGTNQWSAYRVTIHIENEIGNPIIKAKLESNDVKSQFTNSEGRGEIKFRVAGLHVVTITAKDKVTKQIKVHLPQDDNRIITVALDSK